MSICDSPPVPVIIQALSNPIPCRMKLTFRYVEFYSGVVLSSSIFMVRVRVRVRGSGSGSIT